MEIQWSPLALERVHDIAAYIARDNPEAARKWVDELFDTVGRLADHPESGRVVPELGLQRIREVIFGAYRIVYRLSERVEVLTVRRGSQLLRTEEIGS